MKIPLETQRSFYLTLISMIQSLAFGYLLTTISVKDLLTPTYALQVLGTFLVILMVWHEYAVGTMLFMWLIDFWDSLIPFLFGVVQFSLISSLKLQGSPNMWFFSLAACAALSFWSLENQFVKSSAYAENQDALLALGRSRLGSVIYVLVSCGVFVAEGMWSRSAPRNESLLLGLAAASTIILIVFAVRGIYLYPRVMRKLM